MRLPHNLISGVYEKPKCYLCETDKTRICPLETSNMNGSFKFNAYSTLSFDVARVYNNIITGETKVNPFYDKVEAVRLVELDGFGYFELQDPDISGDGIKEIKSLQANSYEYTLSQKYLENIYVNTGKVDSIEVMYAEEKNLKVITPVTFYNTANKNLSLLHIILEKAYGWKIGHVDESLRTMRRSFEIDRISVYDFIMNEICDKFNCYAVFDTYNNTINFYAEALTNRFFGDGKTTKFNVCPVFPSIETVSIDGYKTTNYTYNNVTGQLTLGTAPVSGVIIEVTDGSLSAWETDVYVTFDNLAQQMNVSYTSDDIKTVLTVKGADDLDIREVNNGLPYIVDLSYFYTPEWMGQDLYDAYKNYITKCAASQEQYKTNSANILEFSNRIDYETDRLSLRYSEVSVSSDTIGTYYVRGGNASSGYYYTEVKLPADYVAGTTYYSTYGSDLTEAKVASLYEALKKYYHTGETTGFTGSDSTLIDDFSFMTQHTLNSLVNTLGNANISKDDKDAKVIAFFIEMWNQIGLTPLKTLYLDPYKTVQTTNVSAGWANQESDNYGLYYPVVLVLQSIENAMKSKETIIAQLKKTRDGYVSDNAEISESLLIDNNFTDAQMVRLNAFLREDEYTDDNFVATGNESTEELFKLKQELLECGHVELSKLCEPCFSFSMSLANIYALPEFAPIVDQFQLGNLIKVALRPDYVRHTRLMQVDLNFEDFSDFSCEFGNLSSINSQTDLHADLLSQAVSAGKTVASNASYWNKGTDVANFIDVRLQQGLLNAATEIKSIDATQNAFIDKYGIHLQEVDPNTGEVSDKQGWIVNNKFVYSDDGFKTAKSVFGEYTIDDQTYWGLLAEAVIAGYIEGSTIKGGTIQIGERPDGSYNLSVDENGYITMIGGKGQSSNGETVDLDDYNTTVEVISSGTTLNSNTQKITLTCRVYSYGIDITDSGSFNFTWLRSTGDSVADQEWNNTHNNEANSNTITITTKDVTDVAFFVCRITLASGVNKASNSVAITVNSSDVNVFTSRPNSTLSDGYCYHKGDLWVVGDDYQPTGYEKNTILVSIANSASYSDNDWVESAYYSKTFKDLNDRTTELEQHVIVDSDGLHLRASSNDDVTFESLLTSKELAFGTRQETGLHKVIWLGMDDMNARNVTVENYVNIKAADNNQPYMKLGNFTFQIEDNGSLSIM